MKKYFSLFVVSIASMILIKQAFAYTLTNDDNSIVNRATSKIEQMITNRGESYRVRYIRALQALQLRYLGNERFYTIIAETISNINNTNNNDIASVFGNITSPSTTPIPITTPIPTTTVGGQRDSHGCLIPGGYSWCDATQKCIRSWEEKCNITSAPVFTSLDISPINSLPLTTGKEIVFNANVTSTNADEVKFTINWGDGTTNSEYTMNMMANTQGTYTPHHTFATAGQYWIDGTVTSITTNLSTKAGLRVNIESSTTVTTTRYPGCNQDDIVVGAQYWASCNVGASSPNQNGTFFEWGKDGTWTIRSLATAPVDSFGNQGPCAIGYHVPSLKEIQYAGSNTVNGGIFALFEKIGVPPAGMIKADGSSLGSGVSPYIWLADWQDLVGVSWWLETVGSPTITNPMKYVNNNFSGTSGSIGANTKAQVRCVKDYN